MTHRDFISSQPEPDVMPITEACLRQIEATVGSMKPENGMLLGGDRRDGVIRHVYFDRTAERSGVTYSPDVEAINGVLRDWWNPSRIAKLGFVHSHPGLYAQPSDGDLVYAEAILRANPKLERLALPIVTVEGGFAIHPFYVERTPDGVRWRKVGLRVLREQLVEEAAPASAPAPQTVAVADASTWLTQLRRWLRPRPWWEGASFARVQSANDLPRLARCRLVVVGVGGAMAWVEEMARCGIGEFVLVDPDRVSWSNIGTQQVYADEIGLAKVEALRLRLRRINSKAKVWTRHAALDDLSDEEVTRLCGLRQKERPLVTLLGAMTDSFFAQARMNRLALHLGLPLLAGQMYAEGRGIEVVWSYPGQTRACHRCTLRPRFRAFLEEGYVNDVGSTGTPLFSTTRLTALKGFLALAMLHHEIEHPRWGRLLERIGQRTLIQARLHPDLELPAFAKALGTGERIFCDETLWIEPRPHAECPDCDGLGADRSLIGRDGDTRLLRRERSQ